MIQEDQKVGDHVDDETEQKDPRSIVLNETFAGQTKQQTAQYTAATHKTAVHTDQFDCVFAERLRVADGGRKDRRIERQFETCIVEREMGWLEEGSKSNPRRFTCVKA